MISKLRHHLKLAVASSVILLAGVIATGPTANAMSTTPCDPNKAGCISLDTNTWDSIYRPGREVSLRFNMTNISDQWVARKTKLFVQLPEGMSIDLTDQWAVWPNNGSLTFDPATRVITYMVKSDTSQEDLGDVAQLATVNLSMYVSVDADESSPELTVTSHVEFFRNSTFYRVVGDPFVFKPGQPYVLESQSSFSPATLGTSGGTSTFTSTLTNTGTGSSESHYFYINIDDRLTVDTTSVPSECEFKPAGSETYENWQGEMVTWEWSQKLDCEYEPKLNPGESVSFSVKVSAPAGTDTTEYFAEFELSCTSTGDDNSYEATEDGDSVGLLRLVNKDTISSSELTVHQVGSANKPIAMPTTDAEPEFPTAGTSHTFTSYVYNTGANDITSSVTAVVTLPAGFTPESIRATTTDGTASTPVCNLATRTCVFSNLARDASGRISITGTFASSVRHGSSLEASTTASSGALTATDAADTRVSALSDVRLSMQAAGRGSTAQSVRYTVTGANNGPSDLTSPVVKVTLPSGASFVSVPKGCTAKGSTMTCKWSSIEASGVRGLEFEARFGGGSVRSASVSLTGENPVSKDSILKDSADAVIGGTVLPATGSDSNLLAIIALVLLAGGLVLIVPARRRRTL